MDPNDLPRPFGDFTLLRLIAQGGMGAVYLALRPVDEEESQMRHLPRGQEEVCVVKTVRSDLRADREAIGRFLDEARVVQKLTHPRIARTLDAGVIDKTYFLALEFISGRNLRDVHSRAQKLGEALPEALIVHVVSEMLEALDYAHHLKDPATGQPLNIVHRDVSPHNVMLGFDGNTRLIDFGLAAHELKRELTRPGVMVGKLRYNAPEQVRDRALDGRSDVYSAAVVLYEFIANERFYDGLPEEQVWRVAMKGDHRPRSWRDIDIEWRHLLDVALQNDPEKRYRNAREFRAALLDVAEDRGITLAATRKAARAFMAKAFGAELTQEKEMLLQATGIAEARTRLFRSPSELQSAIQNIPARAAESPGEVKVEMKTEILDQNALHIAELRDMMSRLADPNAVTQLPADPIDDGDSEEDADASEDADFHVDTAADVRRKRAPRASREWSQSSRASARSNSGPRAPWPELPDDASLGLAEQALAADDEDDTIEPTRDGRGRSRPSAPPTSPVETASRVRRQRAAEPLPPLPPPTVRPAPSPRETSPLLVLGVSLLLVVGIGLAAMFLLPRLLKPDGAIGGDTTTAVQGDLPEPPTPLPPVPLPPAPLETAADPAAVDPAAVDPAAVGPAVDPAAVDPAVVDPAAVDPAAVNPATVDPAAVDPVANTVAAEPNVEPPTDTPDEPVDADPADTDGTDDTDPASPTPRPRPKPRPKPTPRPRPTPTPTKAPAPKSFGDQVEYLKKNCTQKVRCASSVVRDANRFMQLSPADLRDLKKEAASCVQRCMR